MASGREILQRPLDAGGLAVNGLPHAATGDAAERHDDVVSQVAAEATIRAGADTTETAARIAGDLAHPGTITALTGDVTASGTGSVAATLANLPQSVLLARTALLTADVPMNSHKFTGLLDGSAPQDSVAFHQLADAITAAGGTVANETALAAVNAADGQFRTVATHRDLFQLDKTTSRTAIPGSVIQSTVNAAWWWVRRNSPDPSWMSQAKWYWSDSGSDENDGATSSTPIKTHEEFFLRTNGLVVSPTIIVMGTIPNQTCRIGCLGTVTYKAVLLPISGSSSSFTSRPSTRDPSVNTAYNLTDTAIATSWTAGNGTTSYLNKLLVARNGGSVTGTCFVDRDLGSKTMRPCPVSNTIPVLVETDAIPIPGAAGTLSSGDTYIVYDLTQFGISQMTSIDPLTQVTTYGLNFTNTFTPVGMAAFVPTHSYFTGGLTINGVRYQPHQCVNANGLTINSMPSVGFPHFHTVRQGMTVQSSLWNSSDELLLSNGFFVIAQGAVINCNDLGLFDGATITPIARSTLYTGGYVWGNNNGSAAAMALGTSGNWWVWNVSKPPTVTGAASPFSIGGVAFTAAQVIAGPITYPALGSGISAGGN